MFCWEVLELDATSNLKEIKTAYAKKLKHTRPDEKPVEFQELHKAYKQALAYAKNSKVMQNEPNTLSTAHREATGKSISSSMNEEVNPVIISDTHTKHEILDSNITLDDNSDHLKEVNNFHLENNYQDESINTENIKEIEEQQDIKNAYCLISEKCNDVIQDGLKRNNIEEWQFLLQSPYILDTDFNTELGHFLFEIIDAHNVNITNNTKTRRKKKYSSPNDKVKNTTIQYLNKIFHWSTQIDLLYDHINQETCDRLLSMIEEQAPLNDYIQGSVMGGTLDEKSIKKPTNTEEYAHIENAFDSIIKLFNIAAIFTLILLAIAIAGAISEKAYPLVSVFIGLIGFTLVQWYALRKKKKLALYTMWPFSVLLLFQFPIGTIWGGIFLVNLYKCRHYYHYH